VIGGLLATLAGSAWAPTALRYGITALSILLFLLALRRSGERAGRLAAENFQLGTDQMTEDELADYQANNPDTFIVWHFLAEINPDDLALLDLSVTYDQAMIASDSMFWVYFNDDGQVVNYEGDEWPLPDNLFSHPRSAGTYAKVLRSYVRERGLMSLNNAIRKLSLMPAQTLEGFVPQMQRKGRLQVGMDADIVVFDPETIADMATFDKPAQPAVGVQTVLVNGRLRGAGRRADPRCGPRPADPPRREVTHGACIVSLGVIGCVLKTAEKLGTKSEVVRRSGSMRLRAACRGTEAVSLGLHSLRERHRWRFAKKGPVIRGESAAVDETEGKGNVLDGYWRRFRVKQAIPRRAEASRTKIRHGRHAANLDEAFVQPGLAHAGGRAEIGQAGLHAPAGRHGVLRGPHHGSRVDPPGLPLSGRHRVRDKTGRKVRHQAVRDRRRHLEAPVPQRRVERAADARSKLAMHRVAGLCPRPDATLL
jgi:hypothetical protein